MSAPSHLPSPSPAPVVEPDKRETPEHDPSAGDGDHDRFAHYVPERELARYRETGAPVTALCGKKWKPDGDPSRYPMCPTCAEIAAERISRSLDS